MVQGSVSRDCRVDDQPHFMEAADVKSGYQAIASTEVGIRLLSEMATWNAICPASPQSDALVCSSRSDLLEIGARMLGIQAEPV
jgi:hypothetical protein